MSTSHTTALTSAEYPKAPALPVLKARSTTLQSDLINRCLSTTASNIMHRRAKVNRTKCDDDDDDDDVTEASLAS